VLQLEIRQFPCLKDNYGVLIHDSESGLTAAIDTPEAAAIERELAAAGWRLTHILNTHHHGDHTGGNLRLKATTGCIIIGPEAEAAQIPGIDTAVAEGSELRFAGHRLEVLDTPGHTSGHIAYVIGDAELAFVGDTLFALGCGRVFEGTMQQMWSSLAKLRRLPPATKVYCGHEYTQANAAFALTIEPGNRALEARAAEISKLRARGEPTVPTTIAAETATNPFLRWDSAEIRRRLGLDDAAPHEVFAEIRRRKDRF
jgi:hydroxyacylglutathione hydrolase